MGFKSTISQAAFKRSILLSKLTSTEKLNDFIVRFRENYVSCNLIRIGGEGDGGYLVPDNLEQMKYCFSPGVGNYSNFEQELSKKYSIRSYMADASVKSTPIDDSNFEFLSKFIGSRTHHETITLSDWIKESIGYDNGAKILQMDIEGSEYEVLAFEDIETIASFSMIIIEFHELQKLFQSDFLRAFSSIFEKIYKNFKICHVHPNNGCGIAELNGITVPKVMEVTFIRNDLNIINTRNDDIALPHVLDRKNVDNIPDLVMPEIWWKS
jgi:hypothetical protein